MSSSACQGFPVLDWDIQQREATPGDKVEGRTHVVRITRAAAGPQMATWAVTWPDFEAAPESVGLIPYDMGNGRACTAGQPCQVFFGNSLSTDVGILTNDSVARGPRTVRLQMTLQDGCGGGVTRTYEFTQTDDELCAFFTVNQKVNGGLGGRTPDGHCTFASSAVNGRAPTFRALLSLGAASPGGMQWPLGPNLTYTRPGTDGVCSREMGVVFTTDAAAMPQLVGDGASGNFEFWTGLTTSNGMLAAGQNCEGWMAVAPGAFGAAGVTHAGTPGTPASLLSSSVVNCATVLPLLCVETQTAPP